MSPTERPDFLHRNYRWLVLLVLVLAFAWMLAFSRSAIENGRFHDPDDTLRLVQVRDLLAGQSWFDVTQYRMNPPNGAPMHWSRLVDLPIVVIILLLRPLVGQAGAETAALIVVPLLTLGIVMALVGALARRLAGPGTALLAIAAVPFSLTAITQLKPMRIDHHGWQIVMGLIMAVAVLDPRPRRSALAAGAAAAVWLNISVEALPFTAAVGLWFGLAWLKEAEAGVRLRYFTAALAVVSLLLFALTKAPSAWPEPWCDAVSPAYLAALVVAAIGCNAGVRSDLRSWRSRALVIAGCAASAGAALWLTNPQCARDPFAALDPMVKRYWHDTVLEGLPLWRQSTEMALTVLAQPLVGALGALIALRRSARTERPNWLAYSFLLGTSMLAGIFVLRASALANLIALAGTAYLAFWALMNARSMKLMLARVLATVLSLGIMAPVFVVPGLFMPEDRPAGSARKSAQTMSCPSRSELRKLNRLPAATVAASLDLGPAILVDTHHRVIASSHHRNMVAMRDVLRFFMLSPEEARSIARVRRIEYVVVCWPMAELNKAAARAPAGLWTDLRAGRHPGWLEPLDVPGAPTLRVWKVRKDRLPAGLTPRRT